MYYPTQPANVQLEVLSLESQESLPSLPYSNDNKTNQTYTNKKSKTHPLFFLICSLFFMNPKYSGEKMAFMSQFWCAPKSQGDNFADVE